MSDLKRRRPRRSNGCEPCKTRRMRCSETKPICQECSKRDIACTYRSSNIIFQSENAFIEQAISKDRTRKNSFAPRGAAPQQDDPPIATAEHGRVQRRRRKQFDSSDTDSSPRPKSSPSSTSGTDLSQSDTQRLLHVRAPAPASPLESVSDPEEYLPSAPADVKWLPAATSNQKLLRTESAADNWTSLANPRNTNGMKSPQLTLHRMPDQETHALYVFFNDFLPCEIVLGGHRGWTSFLKTVLNCNSMLHNLVLAIARINIGASISDYPSARKNRVEALELYASALREIQSALYDTQRALDDDVLVAVNLLGVYELVKGGSMASVEQHLQGGLSLIRARGPAVHRKPNLFSMIVSGFQNHSIRCAIESRTPTFFAEPEWVEAAKNWQPMGFNKWCGTELNTILLRVTTLNATDKSEYAHAEALESDIVQTRSEWVGEGNFISNALLETRSLKAQAIGLSKSPIGSHSCCYDQGPGSYRMTQAAIMFDWALLTLYLAYPKLLRSSSQGHSVMIRLIQAVQYVIHDRRNHIMSIVSDLISPILDSTHWVQDEGEFGWVLHLLSTSCVSMAIKVGEFGKASVLKGLSGPQFKMRQPMFTSYLEETGLTSSISEVPGATDLTDDGLGFRSTRLSESQSVIGA